MLVFLLLWIFPYLTGISPSNSLSMDTLLLFLHFLVVLICRLEVASCSSHQFSISYSNIIWCTTVWKCSFNNSSLVKCLVQVQQVNFLVQCLYLSLFSFSSVSTSCICTVLGKCAKIDFPSQSECNIAVRKTVLARMIVMKILYFHGHTGILPEPITYLRICTFHMVILSWNNQNFVLCIWI